MTALTLSLGQVIIEHADHGLHINRQTDAERRCQVVRVQGDNRSLTHPFPPIGSRYVALRAGHSGVYWCFDVTTGVDVVPYEEWTPKERVRRWLLLGLAEHDNGGSEERTMEDYDRSLVESVMGEQAWGEYHGEDWPDHHRLWLSLADYVMELRRERDEAVAAAAAVENVRAQLDTLVDLRTQLAALTALL